ncbi:MAG: NADP-dependent malic enzyme [Acidobacteria bacterium]|nr:NADP-dependent malic enzyme [Acidobacteriota bacterium]
MPVRKQDALDYHALPIPGKISVQPTKPFRTQLDLSLAYTPGVAEACLEIARDPEKVWKYTSRANLVAVVTNGTAVLGLGNIGAAASKPVMEGKAVLFKRFADIDVFDIELNTQDPDEIIQVVKMIEPTFGGINLEDIKAPECFYIEETLRDAVDIPVFHDDQHGTAIISGAALINALQLADKKAADVQVVFNGAGAASTACANLYLRLGVRPENLLMCDSKGVIYQGRTAGMNPYKQRFARDTSRRTLTEALEGADVFVGVSVANAVTGEMLKRMGPKPIVFALANPDPEIGYEEAIAARADVIMATGRSDYPNQVNNVLGFPFIFRGALDVHATTINEEMKLAAAHALADLTRLDVPDSVRRIYRGEDLQFGPRYIIPKPFDPRVLEAVATAVAKAAIDSGVARKVLDIEQYSASVALRLDSSQQVFQVIVHRAQADPRRIVFPEGDHEKIVHAARILHEEGIAYPVLLGKAEDIAATAKQIQVSLDGIEIIDPAAHPRWEEYRQSLYESRQRKGVTLDEAAEMLRNATVFGAMMVRHGDVDGMVAGVRQHYPETIRPALQVVGVRPGVRRVAGLYMLILNRQMYFLADATVNIDPTAEDLAEITLLAAERIRHFDLEPRVALLSFSNFGSTPHPSAEKVRRAVELVKQAAPDLIVDGEMQADTALNPDLIEEYFPFSKLRAQANLLVFPNLEAANISYKLLAGLAGAQAVGPILLGMGGPIGVVQKGIDIQDIVNMAAITVLDAQEADPRVV